MTGSGDNKKIFIFLICKRTFMSEVHIAKFIFVRFRKYFVLTFPKGFGNNRRKMSFLNRGYVRMIFTRIPKTSSCFIVTSNTNFENPIWHWNLDRSINFLRSLELDLSTTKTGEQCLKNYRNTNRFWANF